MPDSVTTIVLRHVIFDYSHNLAGSDPQQISIANSAALELLSLEQQVWDVQQGVVLRADCLRDLARCYSHLRIVADLTGAQATYFLLRWGSAVPEMQNT